MKCHSLFSVENKKNIINLSSAEFAHRLVMVIVSRTLIFASSIFIIMSENLQSGPNKSVQFMKVSNKLYAYIALN